MATRSGAAALVLAAAMGVTAGCTSAPEASGTPRVATLASAPAASSAPASAAPERPRERLDGTPEDWAEMIKPYEKCMAGHGLDPKGMRLGGDGAAVQPARVDEKKYAAADADCRPRFYPLPPWEYDPANPEAKDFARDVVACLKRKGVKYVEVNSEGRGFSFGGEQNHAESISRGLEYAPACEREVAAGQ
jgi:hypothetical protein